MVHKSQRRDCKKIQQEGLKTCSSAGLTSPPPTKMLLRLFSGPRAINRSSGVASRHASSRQFPEASPGGGGGLSGQTHFTDSVGIPFLLVGLPPAPGILLSVPPRTNTAVMDGGRDAESSEETTCGLIAAANGDKAAVAFVTSSALETAIADERRGPSIIISVPVPFDSILSTRFSLSSSPCRRPSTSFSSLDQMLRVQFSWFGV